MHSLDPHTLGQHLIKAGHLQPKDLAPLLARQALDDLSLGALLRRSELVAEDHLAAAYCRLLDLAPLDEHELPAVPICENLLSTKFLKAAHALPIRATENDLTIALVDPDDNFVLSAIGLACGRSVLVRVATPTQLEQAFARIYETSHQTALADLVEQIDDEEPAEGNESVERLRDLAGETPVVRLVSLIIKQAVELGASDIHIEPFQDQLKIRFRVDGVLQEAESPPARSAAAVISRIKIMGKLNIAERRRPQDGRIPLRVSGKEIDLRVSSIPTLHGESVVLRVLDKQHVELDFERLGFCRATDQAFFEVLKRPQGILLITGPTGSGKTTTLYTALKQLNTPGKKLVTVEDPVEYQLEGINQLQVKPQIDLSFANALRSIVRQDPDIIMIGEMRDQETASIAVQSALTGHLVLSTLHTNNAGSALTRLLDMGVDDYLLTSTISGILAQRLVRVLCAKCKRARPAEPEEIEEWELARLGVPGKDPQLHDATGCESCADTGYKGRNVIREFLMLNPDLRRLVLKHADGIEIQQAAMDQGMQTMKEHGITKALQGITTLAEIARVTQEL